MQHEMDNLLELCASVKKEKSPQKKYRYVA